MGEWFRVIEKGTRERQHVLCDPAEVRRLYPQAHFYLPRPLDGEPGEADVYAAGRLARCDAAAARIEAEATLNRMSRTELVQHIIDKLKG